MPSSEHNISRRRRARLWWTPLRAFLAVLPVLLLAAVYLAATIDIRSHDGRVLRGVRLGQVSVSGMTPEDLDVELDRLSSFVEIAPVYIKTDDAAYQIDADRLGLTLDRDQIRAEVFSAGRNESGFLRPFNWLKRFARPEIIHPDVALDAKAAEAGLAAVSRTISVEPGDPTMVLENGRLELEPGTPGSILDVERLMSDLGASLPDEPGQEIVVNAYTTSGPLIDVEIQDLIDRVNVATQQPVKLFHNLKSDNVKSEFLVPTAIFRSWLKLELGSAAPNIAIDESALFEWVNEEAGVANAYINTRELTVVGDKITAPEINAWQCCAGGSGQHVLETVLGGTNEAQIEILSDNTDPLVRLGVAELVSEFTTEHPPGQARVVNIQRMADIVRGAVIDPGETFSLNGYVGQRTESNGFVSAGVIYEGEFSEDIGGGVSQFSTTLFNAAFYAGLDIPTHQAHTIYIERYPYGREATLNWPTIDLRITNPTSKPVLIWTEYEDDSITVKLFGTKEIGAEETGQKVEEVGQCSRVTTERTRTFADGSTKKDSFVAQYQPSEGIGCDGQPTKPPPECEEDEVLVDSDQSGHGDVCRPLEQLCPEGTFPYDSNGNGVIDSCGTQQCPEGTEPFDSENSGTPDTCK